MHVRDALDRIEQIHFHLSRTEVYRGFRVPAVAAVGGVAFLAAAIQPSIPLAEKGIGFVWFWIAVASVCALIGSAAAIHAYACHEDEFARRRSRQVFAQFAPCILAGGAMTLGIARSPEFIAVLPGLWAAVFGLGLIATRPHLPRGIGLVGLGYITSGAASILRMSPGDDPSGWVVGGTFGLGHLCTALVLWMGRDEDTHE